jgi:hypothetical protein
MPKVVISPPYSVVWRLTANKMSIYDILDAEAHKQSLNVIEDGLGFYDDNGQVFRYYGNRADLENDLLTTGKAVFETMLQG